MKRFVVMTLALPAMAFMLVGCPVPKPGPDEKTKTEGTDGGPDQAKMMLDSMKTQKTMYMVALPPGAAKGIWWEHSMGETKVRYNIVDEKDGKLIVEKEMKVGDAVLVEAWEVDPEVDMTKTEYEDGESLANNVTKAWIGIKGKAPEERPVMDAPVYKKGEVTGGPTSTDVEEGDESVEAAGKSWDCHWVEAAGNKMWSHKGFLIKSTNAEGKVTMELTGWGEDAESALKWGE